VAVSLHPARVVLWRKNCSTFIPVRTSFGQYDVQNGVSIAPMSARVRSINEPRDQEVSIWDFFSMFSPMDKLPLTSIDSAMRLLSFVPRR